MPPEILGKFAQNLQGMMHTRSAITQRYITPSTISAGLGGHVNLTKTGWVPVDHATNNPKTIDLPALTAFYPTPDPNTSAPAYIANVGIYPYAEIGILTFQTEGVVDAVLRINTSGLTGSEQAGSFSGGYRFDDETGITGVISLQWAKLDNHVWDYLFVRLSPNDLSVITGDRLPRPAVAAGTLRRIC